MKTKEDSLAFIKDNYKEVVIPLGTKLTKEHQIFNDKIINEVVVFNISESYTTQICTICGFRRNKTSKKHIYCPFCCFSLDRDVNAARNILMRYTKIYSSFTS